MKKSLAFLVDFPYQERDFQRFGFNILSKYFDLHLIEFYPINSDNNHFLSKQERKSSRKKYNIISIKGYDHFYSYLCNNRLNYYVDMMGASFLSFRIRLQLKKRNTLRIKIILGLLPWLNNKINIVEKISNLIKTGKPFIKLTRLIFSKLFSELEPSVDVFLFSGSKSQTRPSSKVFEIWTHSFDYQKYLELENKFDDLGNYALFIDQYAPSHPDYKFHNNKPPVSKNTYYNSLNNFFDFFQKKTGLKIVIAGHPRRDLGTSNDWNGREQIIGKTPELVRQASIVLSHYSTSLSYAVIFRIPILLITSDEYENSYRKHQISAFSDALKVHKVNTDKYNEFEITNEIFNINETSFLDYEEKYIKSKYSKSDDIWQHFSERLLEFK